MPTIESHDGTRLFYRSWGEGPAVVFAHGWMMNSDIWQPQMFLLARAGFRAVAYDRRAHGRSDDGGGGYDFDSLADDLGAVLEGLDLTGVTLVGHSMGNGEITRYLTRHGPGRVARVVMQAPSLPYALKSADNPDGTTEQATYDAWHRAWVAGMVEWLAPAVRAAYGPDASPDRADHTLRMMLACPLQAAIETNAALSRTDFRDELTRITVPTLILHGDADQSCPLELTGRRTAALIPGARLKVYPGAGHAFIGSDAAGLAADIIAFAREGEIRNVA